MGSDKIAEIHWVDIRHTARAPELKQNERARIQKR
jgi:hypothetical protein